VRRALLAACALVLVGAPAAHAGTAAGRLVYCDTGDECRYFPDPRLDVTFRAAPGEENQLSLFRSREPIEGVQLVDFGAHIALGPYCQRGDVGGEAFCGPPAPEGISLTALTGDRTDDVHAEIGTAYLGPGNDVGTGESLHGGPGRDTLTGYSADSFLYGGPGPDRLSGGRGDDRLDGGRGDDRIVAGRGRDLVRCGPGRDVARVDRRDRVRGCEKVLYSS
jgi:RTX calcium-binding nonapeptide repeat (4 copies)